jgi:hypothetical protein
MKVSEEAKDFAKQLVLYADAITAFAVAQLLAFIYLLAHGDCFTVNVMSHVYFPIAGSIIVSGAYVFLVCSCHRGVNRIFKLSKNHRAMAPLVKRTWKLRYAIIILGCAATVGVLGLVAYSMSKNIFSIDCKDAKISAHRRTIA